MSRPIRIIEVGPRDGLQNEAQDVSADIKIELVERLAQAGLGTIETGSFVSPKWVPQMATSEAVFQGLKKQAGTRYSALTPNLKGLERAMAAGADEVAVFASASEAFSQKNINCSIQDSLQRFLPVLEAAKAENLPVRGYVSCIALCPYQGEVTPDAVLSLSQKLLDMGCYEVSLGDTIGAATPGHMKRLLDVLIPALPAEQLALHCHDTYGQALANIYTGLEYGIFNIDSSIAGLGGCPYAKGASGNVATEDVVYMLDGMGLAHNLDLSALIATGHWISEQLGRTTQSKVGQSKGQTA